MKQDNYTINYRKEIYPLLKKEDRYRVAHIFNRIPLVPVDHVVADDYRMVPIYDRADFIKVLKRKRATMKSDTLKNLLKIILEAIDEH